MRKSTASCQSIKPPATTICPNPTRLTNSTSCTPARTASASEVMRLMIRPSRVSLKKLIGIALQVGEDGAAEVVDHRFAQLSASRWRKWKTNCVKAARAKNPHTPQNRPSAECPAIGPLMTFPSVQANSGNWIDRMSTMANRRFRLRACGRVYPKIQWMSPRSSGRFSNSLSESFVGARPRGGAFRRADVRQGCAFFNWNPRHDVLSY